MKGDTERKQIREGESDLFLLQEEVFRVVHCVVL